MAQLKRTLGFWQAYAAATGLVVAGSTMVSLGNSFGTIGPAFMIAAFIAMVISILIALSYAELSSLMPGTGMIGDYTLVSMGRFMAIIAVLGGYLVLAGTIGPMETMTASMAIEYFAPGVNTLYVAIVLLVIFLVVNILGVDLFGVVQIAVVGTLMVSMAVMGIFGLNDVATVAEGVATTFNPNGWGTVMQSFALGLWLFIGIEYVIPLGEEVKKPERTIPRAMIFGLLTIFVVDMLFGYALTKHIDLGTLATADIPQIVGATAMFGEVGGIIMAGLTLFAAVSTINASFAAVPRMFYGLARQGLLPKIFSYVHPKFRTPVVSTFFVFLLFLCPLFVLDVNVTIMMTLLLSASVTWLITYIIAQVNVLILRKCYPNMARPFKAPFSPFIQIIGIIACVYMIVTVHPDGAMRLTVFTIAGSFLAIIILYATVWLKYKKLPFFKPVPIEQLHNEVEQYEPVIIPTTAPDKVGDV